MREDPRRTQDDLGLKVLCQLEISCTLSPRDWRVRQLLDVH